MFAENDEAVSFIQLDRKTRRQNLAAALRATRTRAGTATSSVAPSDESKKTVAEMLRGTGIAFFAPKLLLFGCIIGLLGFFLVCGVVIACNRESMENVNECLDYQPLPATISEIVHRWDRVCGRVFFGFSFLSGLSIYLSKFGFIFRNCASDQYVQFPPCLGCCDCLNRLCHVIDLRWCDVRMFVAPIGMLLVCLVPTVPLSTYDLPSLVMLSTHGVAAFMMFLGVFACELQFWCVHVTTEWAKDRDEEVSEEGSTASPSRGPRLLPQMTQSNPDRIAYHMSRSEFLVRGAFNLGNISFFMLFLCFQALMFCKDCSLDMSFIAIPQHGPGKTFDCAKKWCKDVHTPAACADANRFFRQTVWELVKASPNAREVHRSDLPIMEKPFSLGDEQWIELRRESLKNAFAAYSLRGCYFHLFDGGEVEAAFQYNHYNKTTAMQWEKRERPFDLTAVKTYQVCACGQQQDADTETRTSLTRLEPGGSAVNIGHVTRTEAPEARLEVEDCRSRAPETVVDSEGARNAARAKRTPGLNKIYELSERGKKTHSDEIVKEVMPGVTTWEGGWEPSCKYIAYGSFCSEVLAAVCCVSLHLVIWYYAEERLPAEDRANTTAHGERWKIQKDKMERRLQVLEEEMLLLLETDEDIPEAPQSELHSIATKPGK